MTSLFVLQRVDWDNARATLKVDNTVPPVTWAVPGTRAGLMTLREFCKTRLKTYGDLRNDPNENCTSGLSPWLHFGEIMD